MRNFITTLILFITLQVSYGQTINWANIDEKPNHIVYLNLGYDYGVTSQIGYAKNFEVYKPIILSADLSRPMGNIIMDDFKIRIGAQIKIVERNNFVASAKIYPTLKRHQTKHVSMVSIGSEYGGMLGYHKENWHVGIEVGIEDSRLTRLVHSNELKEQNSSLADGWITSSSSYLNGGIQASKTISKRTELTIRLGTTNALYTDYEAVLPYYIQIGLVIALNKG